MWMLGGWLFVIGWSVWDVSKVNILWGGKIDSSCRINKYFISNDQNIQVKTNVSVKWTWVK